MAFPDVSTVRSYGGGAVPSVLTGSGISATGTTFTVADVSTWVENGSSNPLGTSGPFVVAIDYGESNEEKVLCSAVDTVTNTITVYSSGGSIGRAYDNSAIALGTSAGTGVTHATNAVVVPVLTSVEIQQATNVGNKTLGKITAAGDLLVGDASQSLKRLAGGTSGQFLKTTGTDASWSNIAASNLSGTGGTAGQRLVSTGASSAPTWQSVATARIYKTSTQSIASGTSFVTATSFDGTDFNVGSFTISLSSGTITIPTGLAGKYAVNAHCRFAAVGATTTRIGVSVQVNGAAYGNVPVRSEMGAANTYLVAPAVSDIITLAVGDVVSLTALQNSGSAVNITEAALSLSLVSQ